MKVADGRLYISDKTAESYGGRQQAEEVFRRVGNSGHIVVYGPDDSKEDVEKLFWQAKRGSLGFFSWVSQKDMDTVLQMSRDTPMPALMMFDLNRDGKVDIGSYNDKESHHKAFQAAFPGDPLTVRQFTLGHEIGHFDGHKPDDFWRRWQNERDSDIEGFEGIGAKGTREFREGILAARAGNAIGDMIAMQDVKNSDRSTHSMLVNNPEFIHTSVLGIFLQGEEGFEVTQDSLNSSLDRFRDQVLGRIYDQHLAQNPRFRLDLTSVTASDVDYFYESKFTEFVARHGPAVQGRYEPFTNNLKELNDKVDKLWEEYTALGDDPEKRKDGVYEKIQQTKEAMKVELQQALDFMRETDPKLYRQHIVDEYFGLFNRQAGVYNLEIGDRTPEAFIKDIHRPTLKIIQDLRAEGAFADDPIQKRLSDYMIRDSQIRPELYGLGPSDRVSGPSAPTSLIGPR